MLEFHTSARCPVCNKRWLDYEDGKFFCEECQKNIDINAINFNLSDLYELNIPYTSNEYDNRLEKLRIFCHKFDADFLGFDPFEQINSNHWSGMLEIGWADGWPDNLSKAVEELKKIL
jgi:hypothetical protein